MGQAEIIKLLEKEKRWMSSKEIAKILGVSSTMRALHVLLRNREVLMKIVKVKCHNRHVWKRI